jgi:hypothetical protein
LLCPFVWFSTTRYQLVFFLTDKWKLSCGTPIFKADSRNDVTNYRGIAILSAFAKLFELLIYKNMFKDLQRLISENQHGYVKGRSTVSNLLSSWSLWKMVYRLIKSTPIFLRHKLLLIKLALAVPPDMCGLLSKDIKVTSEVPQGSHFGPLCFIWFINDIAQIFYFLFMPMTWNCIISLWVVPRIVW